MAASSIQSRQNQLEQWLKEHFRLETLTLTPVSGDASFRRYYRFEHKYESFIAVDAPPEQENSRLFVLIGAAYASQRVMVPRVISADFQLGFMCLEDLGDTLLIDKLDESDPKNAQLYYQKALDLLPDIAQVVELRDETLPNYDRAFLKRELDLFNQWFLLKHLNIQLSEYEQRQLKQVFDHLITSALVQPRVGVHRDFHARNLMITDEDKLAVIDFQDAVIGPITYDAVSLLRDCYINWPSDMVYQLLSYFKRQMSKQFIELNHIDEADFITWFDWMGLQRHIKVCGIFSRLYHRDGKSGYLGDLPRVVTYIHEVAGRYSELEDLVELLENKVLPAMNAQSQQSQSQQSQTQQSQQMEVS